MNADNDHPRKRQADAMAAAQAWGLVVHACAMHRGHPHAEAMMADDLAALQQSGALALVVACADELGQEIGHERAISVLSTVLRARPAANVALTAASALAAAIGWDGARALETELPRCQAEAEFWGIVCDAWDQLKDEDTEGEPPDE